MMSAISVKLLMSPDADLLSSAAVDLHFKKSGFNHPLVATVYVPSPICC